MTYNTIQIFYGDIEDDDKDVIETKSMVNQTLRDALEMSLPAPELLESAYVFLNACYIPMMEWEDRRLKRDDAVSICFTPTALQQLMLCVTAPPVPQPRPLVVV